MTIEKTIKLLMLIAKDQPGAANQQLAAAVIYKNQIISIGFNSYKSHPFAAKFSVTSMVQQNLVLAAKSVLMNMVLKKLYIQTIVII